MLLFKNDYIKIYDNFNSMKIVIVINKKTEKIIEYIQENISNFDFIDHVYLTINENYVNIIKFDGSTIIKDIDQSKYIKFFNIIESIC